MSARLFYRALARKGKPVILQTRDEKIISGRSVEVFGDIAEVKALVCPIAPVAVFDSTNTERIATHEVTIEWRADVTAETWVKFKEKRFKILGGLNCCENDKVLKLTCTERGEDSKRVNDA